MTNELQSQQAGIDAISASGSNLTPDQVKLIKATVAKGATDDELRLFLAICGRTGLDPFTKQVHFIKYSEKSAGSVVTGIDGYRLIAQRSNEYAGQGAPMWCGPEGQWTEVWLSNDPPAAAKATVHRKGFNEPIVAIARWVAYKADSPMWSKMGPEMLAKCAEALALRKAFPNELSGLYTAEEMDQAKEPRTGKVERTSAIPEATVVEDGPPPIPDNPKPARSALLGIMRTLHSHNELGADYFLPTAHGLKLRDELVAQHFGPDAPRFSDLTEDQCRTLSAKLLEHYGVKA